MAYNNRGLAYSALGQHQPALMDFDETIRLKPDDPHPYYDRSTVYAKLGQYVRAIEDLDHDILLKPDDIRKPFICHMIGRTWARPIGPGSAAEFGPLCDAYRAIELQGFRRPAICRLRLAPASGISALMELWPSG